MDITNRAVLDDYLLPFIDIAASKLRLAEEHGFLLQCARERDNPTAPTPTTPCPARRDRIVLVSRLAAFAVLLLVMTSAPARADGFLTSFIGYNFGGDSSNCAGLTDCSRRRTSYGVSVGATSTSVGFEEDLSYTKDFFGAAPGAENSVFV